MRNGWTGGQYSLFRVGLGAWLCVHFAALVPWGAEVFSNQGVLPDGAASPLLHLFPNVLALWDAPAVVATLLVAGALLSLLLALGLADRVAAVALWYVWACLHGRNPLIANPGLPYVGWLLLAHAAIPGAPHGSWKARGRADPGGGWSMPPALFAVAWLLMALGYTYSGITKLVSPSWVDGTAFRHVLENPLARPTALREWMLALPDGVLRVLTWGALGAELAFAPLALLRALRPWLWLALLGMHLGLMVLVDFTDLSLGMVMLHSFTFDPAWVRPRGAPATELLLYDGHCGLCHRWIRFLLAEDRAAAFRFAPLGGATFHAAVPEAARASLPDSVVVVTAEGRLLVRSRAALHILRRLGGLWRVLAGVAGLVPRPLLDRAYDGVAAVRHRLFARPTEACPVVAPALRARFTD